jgi:hypothetical protein
MEKESTASNVFNRGLDLVGSYLSARNQPKPAPAPRPVVEPQKNYTPLIIGAVVLLGLLAVVVGMRRGK